MNELRALLPYLRPYRRSYAFGLVLVVISNLFVTLGPRFLEHGIDALRAGAAFRQVEIAAALLLVVALLGGVARYGMRQLLTYLTEDCCQGQPELCGATIKKARTLCRSKGGSR